MKERGTGSGVESGTSARQEIREVQGEAAIEIRKISERVAQEIIDSGGQTESLDEFLVAIAGNHINTRDSEHVNPYLEIWEKLKGRAGQPAVYPRDGYRSPELIGGILAPKDGGESDEASTRLVIDYAYSPKSIGGRQGELYIEFSERLEAGGGLIHTLDGDERMWFRVAQTTTDGYYTSSQPLLVGYEEIIASDFAQSHPEIVAESLQELLDKTQS